MTTQLVEKDNRTGRYDMAYTRAIVDSPEHGRLLIVEGYGGENGLLGGAYRWQHGLAAQLRDNDTLSGLDDAAYSDLASVYDATITAHDSIRSILPWRGTVIAAIARSAAI